MSFTAFPLDKLGLTPAQLQLCTKANYLNAQDVLLIPLPDLSRRLKIRLPEAQALITAISKAIAPRSSLVSSLVGDDASTSGAGLGKRKRGSKGREGEGWIRTGDVELDTLLGGGVRVGSVTEIVGESAAGKSHLSLHLALAAQLPSLTSSPGGTIILTSERELSTTRLTQIGEVMSRRHAQNVFMKRDSLSDGVLTRRVADVEELEDVLSYGVPALLERGRGGPGKRGSRLMGSPTEEDEAEREKGTQAGPSALGAQRPGISNPLLAPSPRINRHPARTSLPAPTSHRAPPAPKPIRLLILDSLAALLRGAETSFSSSRAGLTARSRHLCSVGDKLKALAVEYELAVVVINQVSDVFGKQSYPSTSTDDTPPGPAGTYANGNGNGNGNGYRSTPSQHPTSSQSLTHDQAWYAAGPDPPMLYATQARWFSGQGSSGKKEAALGIVWANAINTRVMLSRTGRRRVLKPEEKGDQADVPFAEMRADGDDEGEGNGERTLIRRAHLIFSPFAPPGTIDFVIRGSGVRALPGTYALDESGARVLARARRRSAMMAAGEEEEVIAEAEREEAGPGAAAEAEADDDLFGAMSGMEDVPDEWWAGALDSELQAEEAAAAVAAGVAMGR
ncbi:putative RAD57 protein [Dioszegia hungarica]|uniref:RAD57 protein n=1 Tax=Dioszegia hungarica TaxID=4972 RepID=A0AA38H9G6_9TREE|nr:putative RAD57 protein [Dioszegia hungarica]KAI9635961.1 putative RAD57 protein [Dioszegia hungarica]